MATCVCVCVRGEDGERGGVVAAARGRPGVRQRVRNIMGVIRITCLKNENFGFGKIFEVPKKIPPPLPLIYLGIPFDNGIMVT